MLELKTGLYADKVATFGCSEKGSVVYFGFVQTESGQVLYTTALLQLNQLFICTMISCYDLRLGCG